MINHINQAPEVEEVEEVEAEHSRPTMHLDRTCASASAFDGQLWLVGGFSTRLRCDLASVLRWLPSTAAWAEVAPLPTARRGVATC